MLVRVIVRTLVVAVAAAWPLAATAQTGTSLGVGAANGATDRPFLFTVSAPPVTAPRVSVYVDTMAGEGSFNLTDSDRPEQRLGVQAALGRRLTFVGRVGLSTTTQQDVRSSQQGELLYSLLQSPDAHASLAIGGGVRHEPAGVNVLLGRVAAGRAFGAWRTDGNALFEKPMNVLGRDAVDLITTIGVSRRLAPAVHLGVEMIGEDLEGLWEPAEAEGGARLLVGPSLRIAPPAQRWQMSVAGGPMIRGSQSGRASEAVRGLPSASGQSRFALRASLGYRF